MIRHCIKAALTTLDAFEGEDIDLVVIPWQFNLRKEGEENSFPQELVKELLEKNISSILERCFLVLAIYTVQKLPRLWRISFEFLDRE